MRIFFIFLVSLFGTLPSWGAENSLPQLPAEQVVARVNGVELRGAALNDYLEVFLPGSSFHGKVQPEKINTSRREALERMILHELIYQDAVRRGLRVPSSQVEAELARMRQRFRTPEAFARSLEKRRLTMEELRALVRRNLLVAEAVRRDITARSRVSDEEVRAYYRKNQARYSQPESVLLRHIIIPSGPGAAGQANEVRRTAIAKNSSEDFDQLARKYSKDDYRVMGGLLGWVHRGRLEPELEEAAFRLRPGETGEVIQTSTGFHLLRVEGKQPERLLPLKEVRENIRAELEAAKAKRLREEMRARLYRNAKVEILARF